MLYAHEFFRTKEEARAFQRERGSGALYSNLPGSRCYFKFTFTIFSFNRKKSK